MALIKCTECGKEISDKATACVHCGCPLADMNLTTADKSASKETAAPNAGGAAQWNDLFAPFFTNGAVRSVKPAPIKTVPAQLPADKGVNSNVAIGIVTKSWIKLSALCLLGGLGAAADFVGTWIGSNILATELILLAIAGLVVGLVLLNLANFTDFCKVKAFLQRNGYEDSIKNDTSKRVNACNAYQLCPGKWMENYIKKLNPKAGEVLAARIKATKKAAFKRRIGYIPYLVILLLAYYLLPDIIMTAIPDYNVLFAAVYAITFAVTLVYGLIHGGNWGIVASAAVLFAPSVFQFYHESLWYHILIVAAVALLGTLIGHKIHLKKK